MSDKPRRAIRLLAVVGIVGLTLSSCGGERSGRGGTRLTYLGESSATPPQIARAATIVRQRLVALGFEDVRVAASGRRIMVELPGIRGASPLGRRAIRLAGVGAQLYFYDWEPNVIGPDGKPDPSNPRVTETPIPSLYEAVVRASKRSPVRDRNNTVNEQWYLFGSHHQRCAGPEESRADLFAERLPASCQAKTQLKINTGTVIVRGEKPDQNQKIPENFNRGWFVVNDNPSLTGADITDPKQEFDQGPGGGGQPIVTMSFTDKGRNAFHDVTRTIAQRGVTQQVPGQPAQNAFQHFAIVLDNELVSRPYIDFNQNPDGIDGRTGAQISGGFTISSAHDLAKTLQFGALPIRLKLIGIMRLTGSGR